MEETVVAKLVDSVVSGKLTARSYFFIARKLGAPESMVLAAILTTPRAAAAIRMYELAHPDEFSQISDGHWPLDSTLPPVKGASDQQSCLADFDNWNNWDNWNNFDNWSNW